MSDETFMEMEARHARERLAMVERMVAQARNGHGGGAESVPRMGAIGKIIAGVCVKHGVTIGQIQAYDRLPAIVLARQEAMAAAYQAGFSLNEIAKFLNRDHTTVRHGVRAHQDSVGAAA